MRRTLWIGFALAAACGAPPPGTPLEQAVGEPMNGFPNPEERLTIEMVNRGRSDPSVVKGAQSAIYPARPPVVWSYDFNRSSRFHAVNLVKTGVILMHTSPCTLNANVATANCDGTPACACAMAVPMMCQGCKSGQPAVNMCGTDTFTRVGYFTAAGAGESARGEVGAAGGIDAVGAVNLWLDEAAGSDGHRQILLDQNAVQNTMGFGFSSGSPCFSNYYFGDTGILNGLVVPRIPTAAVSPVRGAAGTFRVYATWADQGGAPATIAAVVDGTCVSMTHELGVPTLNSTWYADANLAAGCHNYWILARDAQMNRLSYPTNGALTISVGGVACASDYLAQAPGASCEMGGADMAAPVDAAKVADLAQGADLAIPRDLAIARDLAGPRDLAMAPADLAQGSGDLAGGVDLASGGRDLAFGGGDLGVGARDLAGPARDLRGADLSEAADGGGGSSGSGCGCRIGGAPARGSAPWLALALLVLVAGRRRNNPNL
jgi:MYXO-CTERM domain-containing protein